ncbi:SKP1-like protein 21 [Camellia lanceoleosa]|uniref:SKP1-like protein 21 n=1 Tax=Camellia lanceoleosa TaxID=1840588 RepID=A0ACC0ILT6_9ERIC|nr:SKP1-like protein 21 [Camellia lanceoleosa]
MSEADREVIKPEMMKSYIWLQTADGSIEQVEQEVAMFCPIICQEMHTGERRSFDEKFIRMDTKTLCELTSAADSLQLKPLVDLTSRALARMIEGKSPEEIRETFHLPDDLTEEEKLEPLKNITDDPRIRLLNRLYARKRKELQERDRLKNVEAEEERLDDRSLMTFCHLLMEECNGLDSVCHDAKIHDHVRKMLKLQNFQGYSLAQEDEFDDGDLDDEIDPALKEKIDREVEDFARRLNSDWPERMQEILSLDPERKALPISTNGNGSLRRHARLDHAKSERSVKYGDFLRVAFGSNDFDHVVDDTYLS